MEEKFHIKYYFVKLIVSAVLAVLIFVFREQLANYLRFFIGGLVLAYGLEEIAFEVANHRFKFIHQSKTYLGIVEIVLGVTLLALPLDLFAVCIIWATWSIVRESYEIKELINEIKSITLTVISGLESIAVIVLSIMLIAEPGIHHAIIHIYLLLVELILTPLVPLLDEWFEKKKLEKEEAK